MLESFKKDVWWRLGDSEKNYFGELNFDPNGRITLTGMTDFGEHYAMRSLPKINSVLAMASHQQEWTLSDGYVSKFDLTTSFGPH